MRWCPFTLGAASAGMRADGARLRLEAERELLR